MKKRFISILLFVLIFISATIPQTTYANSPVLIGESGFTDSFPSDETVETGSVISPEAVTFTGEINTPSAILMEASTGTIIYEKNADEKLHPASITKIMTLILIFDAIEEGKISLEDTVTVSAYAASMGGSQVFLEEGETQSVETLIKCISVASANDGCVAMAEHIWGTEGAFVDKMNERAKGLGMENTTFVNCCGLDVDNHMTTARDVALMSRELITKYPQIFDYCSIWMENITHVTRKGSSEFGLTNTNKLIKQYEYATGLKTGYTGLAKYCVSATARKDGIDLIAVIMAAPDYRVRFADSVALLNFGFANCSIYKDNNELREPLYGMNILNGVKEKIVIGYEKDFSYLGIGEDVSLIERELKLEESLTAPVKEGDTAGTLSYYLNGELIGTVNVIAKESVKAAGYVDYLKKILDKLFI